MVSTIKAVLISFIYPRLQFLFLSGSMNSGLAFSPKKKKQLYKLLPDQLFHLDVVFPFSYKQKSLESLVEVVPAKNTCSFDCPSLSDALQLHARLVSHDHLNRFYKVATASSSSVMQSAFSDHD